MFSLGCNSNVKSKHFVPDFEKIVAVIEKEISEKDPYKYMGHLRYPTFIFAKTDFSAFDTINFNSSSVVANYDTLERRITSITVALYKNSEGVASQTNTFYYDSQNKLLKINILTYAVNPQAFCSYYFQDNQLVYQKTKNIEVKDLILFRIKVDSIYEKAKKELLGRQLIDYN